MNIAMKLFVRMAAVTMTTIIAGRAGTINAAEPRVIDGDFSRLPRGANRFWAPTVGTIEVEEPPCVVKRLPDERVVAAAANRRLGALMATGRVRIERCAGTNMARRWSKSSCKTVGGRPDSHRCGPGYASSTGAARI
jgi:hypothetical protein